MDYTWYKRLREDCGKLWFYGGGYYEVTYQAGYDLLLDLENDILTLVAWMYENRGKKMNADPKSKYFNTHIGMDLIIINIKKYDIVIKLEIKAADFKKIWR